MIEHTSLQNTSSQDPTMAELEDFLSLKLSESETIRLLHEMTPEKVDEPLLSAILGVMRQQAIPITPIFSPFIDCCGTGGSGLSQFNTSTTVAFVLAAGGIPVIKFGNRAMSSKSGSFDFLEQLGFPIRLPVDRIEEILDETGLVFLFAPDCYPGLSRFTALRRQLGIRTIFNFIGPLLNPFYPPYRLLGVSDSGMQRLMAQHLANENRTEHAWLVRAASGLDELSPSEQTDVYDVRRDNNIHVFYHINEADSFKPASSSSCLEENSDSRDNVAIFHGILAGEGETSPFYPMICLNAGAGFLVAGKVSSLPEGVSYAQDLIQGKKVLETFLTCRRVYAQYA